MAEAEPMEVTPAAAGPAGDNRVNLSTCAEYHTYSCAEQACWATASFKAPFYEPTSRPAVDIVAVIDKSGSMAGVKLDLVKKTLLFVIDQLKECDRMSLVTYDTGVQLVYGLTRMDKANKERSKAFVESIVDGSATNLSGGLMKGMEQIALTYGGDHAQVQSVLLLTDGHANHGITSKDGIVAEMKKMQEQGLHAVSIDHGSHFSPLRQAPQLQQQAAQPQQQRGWFDFLFGRRTPQQQQAPPPVLQQQQQQAPPVLQQQQEPPVLQQQQQLTPPMQQQLQAPKLELTEAQSKDDASKPAAPGDKFEGTVYTFGFGSDHDATLLEAISTQGGGVYYYIDSNEKIPESFADCLGGLLSVMGQNISLKLEAGGDNSITTAHANRTVNWTTPNKSCEIAMGDLQSEEERDIVLELKLPAMASPQQDMVLKATLSYFNVITSEFDTVQSELNVQRGDGDRGAPNTTVDVQRNRILTTAALRKAEPLANQGKLKDAQKVLKDAIDTIEKSQTAKDAFCQALVSDLKKSLESMKSRESYLGHGQLYMQSKMQSHSVQRSNFVDDQSYYQNSSKVGFRMKSKK